MFNPQIILDRLNKGFTYSVFMKWALECEILCKQRETGRLLYS